MAYVVPYSQMTGCIGQSLSSSEWFVIDQSRINLFAQATDDYQYIHIDEAKAMDTELGGTIAHGLLSLSLLPKLVEHSMLVPDNVKMGINYGFDKVRFLHPVRPGDQVRLAATVVDVQLKDEGRVVTKLAVTIDIKDQEKPALVCEWLNMFVCHQGTDSSE